MQSIAEAMVRKRSAQLSLSSPITAFDYAQQIDLLVAASRGSFAFYNLAKAVGSPDYVIFCEQPSQCHCVSLQKFGSRRLTASVIGDHLCVWDPTKLVGPLVDFIQVPSSGEITTRIEFCPYHCEVLATCSSYGNITTWDIRAPISSRGGLPLPAGDGGYASTMGVLRPQHQLQVDRQCQHLQWSPYNPHLVSCSFDSGVVLWDVRMVRPVSPKAMSDYPRECYHVLHCDNPVEHFSWDCSGSLYLLHDHAVTRYSVKYDEQSFICTQHSTQSFRKTLELNGNSAAAVANHQASPHKNMVLAHPRNSYIVLTCTSAFNSKGTSTLMLGDKKVFHADSADAKSMDGFSVVGKCNTGLLGCFWRDRRYYASLSSDIIKDEIPRTPQDAVDCTELVTINENGLLHFIHMPHSGGISQSSWAAEGPPIVQGRQVAHAVQPVSAVKGSLTTYEMETTDAQFASVQSNAMTAVVRGVPHYSILNMKATLNGANATGISEMFAVQTEIASVDISNSRDRVSSLEVYSQQPTTASSAGGIWKYAASLPPAPPQVLATSDSSTRNVVGPVTFCKLLEDEIFALEVGINNKYLKGWRIRSIDQFARRIVLELLLPNMDSYTMTNKQLHHSVANFNHYYRADDLRMFHLNADDFTSRCVRLTIAFPVKCCNFWYPVIELEDRSDFQLDCGNFTTIITELHAISKNFVAHQGDAGQRLESVTSLQYQRRPSSRELVRSALHCNECLLFRIARCCGKRICRLWLQRVNSTTEQFSCSLNMLWITSASTSEQILNASQHSEHRQLDEEAVFMKFIEVKEQWAFRVPQPRNAAGIFNGCGKIICFGAAVLHLKPLIAKDKKSTNAAMPLTTIETNSSASVVKQVGETFAATPVQPHRSFANTLADKMRLEAATTTIDESNSRSSQKIAGTAYQQHEDPSAGGFTQAKNSYEENKCKEKIMTNEELSPHSEIIHDNGIGNDAGMTCAQVEPASEDGNECAAEDEEEETYQFSFDKDVDEQIMNRVEGDEEEKQQSTTTAAPTVENNSSYFVGDLDGHSEHRLDASRHSHTSSKMMTVRQDIGRVTASKAAMAVVRRKTEREHHRIYTVAQQLDQQLMAAYSLGPLHLTATSSAPASNIDIAMQVQIGSSTATAVNNILPDAYHRAAACRHNATVVERIAPQERALIQYWSMLAVALDMYTATDAGGSLMDWSGSTLGNELLLRLFQYIHRINDMQTYAVTLCLLGGSDNLVDLLYPYRSALFALFDGCYDVQLEGSATMPNASEKQFALSEAIKGGMDFLLYTFAEVLRQWDLPLIATEMAKYISYDRLTMNPQLHICATGEMTLSVAVSCSFCGLSADDNGPSIPDQTRHSQPVSDFITSTPLMWCKECRDWAQSCVICELGVRGSLSVCARCGHGGHLRHMRQWFRKYSTCAAANCGCNCALTPRDSSAASVIGDDENASVRQEIGSSGSGREGELVDEVVEQVAVDDSDDEVGIEGDTGNDHNESGRRAEHNEQDYPFTMAYLGEIYNTDSDYNYNNWVGEFPIDDEYMLSYVQNGRF